ncbi:hypothetical protein BJY52DRAFT_1279773, partial [Lactarius psammicola]
RRTQASCRRGTLRGVYHFVRGNVYLTVQDCSHDARHWSFSCFCKEYRMLFTNIQLDDLSPTRARLVERLRREDPEGWEWAMMAAVNVGALPGYCSPQGFLRRSVHLAKIAIPRLATEGAGGRVSGDVAAMWMFHGISAI